MTDPPLPSQAEPAAYPSARSRPQVPDSLIQRHREGAAAAAARKLAERRKKGAARARRNYAKRKAAALTASTAEAAPQSPARAP